MSACQRGRLDCQKIFPFALGFLLLAVTGCAVNPAPIQYPASHPANSGAPESGFVPPLNPFQADAAAMEGGPADDVIKPEKTEENGRQDSDRHMGADQESRPDSESTMPPAHMKGHGQSREHHP